MIQELKMSEAGSYWIFPSLCQPAREPNNFLGKFLKMFRCTSLVLFSLCLFYIVDIQLNIIGCNNAYKSGVDLGVDKRFP